jgi:hypothetical protein
MGEKLPRSGLVQLLLAGPYSRICPSIHQGDIIGLSLAAALHHRHLLTSLEAESPSASLASRNCFS